MLAIRNITPNAYSYTGLNRNVKSNQPQDANNVNFTGDSNQKNSKVAKRVGIGIIALLSALGVCKCSDDDSAKYNDVYITYRSNEDGSLITDTIKWEDGCSVEFTRMKYVMSEGRLWAYDTFEREWYCCPENSIRLKTNYVSDLDQIARAKDEEDGVITLSKADIKYAQKHKKDFQERISNEYKLLKIDGKTLDVCVNDFYNGNYSVTFSYDADKEPDFVSKFSSMENND